MEEKKSDKHSEVKNKVEENKIESQKIKKNPWMFISFFLGIIVIVLLIILLLKPGQVSGAVAGDNVVKFAKSQGLEVSVVNVSDKDGFYMVELSMEDQKFPVYVTKDGKNMVTGLIPLIISDNSTMKNVQQTTTQREVPKTDKPKVELFVMTYCPYGLQAEKGMVPVFKTLGNKIDAKVRFVHYFMHGDKEEKETYNQVCIREEQSSKYLSYLECFVEDGNSDRCINKTGIDKNKLKSCLADNYKKAKEYYEKDKELSENYGVQGSPTLVINGVETMSARDSASFLETVCSAFNVPPSECNKQLSSQSPSPGFGVAAAGTASVSDSGSCA